MQPVSDTEHRSPLPLNAKCDSIMRGGSMEEIKKVRIK